MPERPPRPEDREPWPLRLLLGLITDAPGMAVTALAWWWTGSAWKAALLALGFAFAHGWTGAARRARARITDTEENRDHDRH